MYLLCRHNDVLTTVIWITFDTEQHFDDDYQARHEVKNDFNVIPKQIY